VKSIAEGLFDLAQRIAAQTPEFQKRHGPGGNAGNGATNKFLKSLNGEVAKRWPTSVRSQEPVASGMKYSFDYFIPSERTAVEIALSIWNSVSEFEKDIFKAILAKDTGKPLRKLVLIGKDGSVRQQKRPGPSAIMAWVKRNRGIGVEVKELT
jgi:hypothetical protein